MTLMLRDQENLAKGEERMVKLAQILTSAEEIQGARAYFNRQSLPPGAIPKV